MHPSRVIARPPVRAHPASSHVLRFFSFIPRRRTTRPPAPTRPARRRNRTAPNRRPHRLFRRRRTLATRPRRSARPRGNPLPPTTRASSSPPPERRPGLGVAAVRPPVAPVRDRLARARRRVAPDEIHALEEEARRSGRRRLRRRGVDPSRAAAAAASAARLRSHPPLPDRAPGVREERPGREPPSFGIATVDPRVRRAGANRRSAPGGPDDLRRAPLRRELDVVLAAEDGARREPNDVHVRPRAQRLQEPRGVRPRVDPRHLAPPDGSLKPRRASRDVARTSPDGGIIRPPRTRTRTRRLLLRAFGKDRRPAVGFRVLPSRRRPQRRVQRGLHARERRVRRPRAIAASFERARPEADGFESEPAGFDVHVAVQKPSRVRRGGPRRAAVVGHRHRLDEARPKRPEIRRFGSVRGGVVRRTVARNRDGSTGGPVERARRSSRGDARRRPFVDDTRGDDPRWDVGGGGFILVIVDGRVSTEATQRRP